MTSGLRQRVGGLGTPLAVILAVTAMPGAAQERYQRLTESRPSTVAGSRYLGRLSALQPIRLAVTLPLRDQDNLTRLIERLYDPADPLYHRYLTPEQFAQAFGPTEQDYKAVADYFVSRGFRVTETYSNRALLGVEATANVVESALGVGMHRFQAPDGRRYYAADAPPALPVSVATRVAGVIGMDDAHQMQPQFVVKQTSAPTYLGDGGLTPNGIGTGHGGGLAPNDIKTAYDLNVLTTINNGVTVDGTNQTIAVVEFAAYSAAAITAYENYYGLPHTTLTNVNVDGGPGTAIGPGEVEAALDIELIIALAPKVKALYIYQSPNTFTAAIHMYNKIATDNKAAVISTSWGLWEADFTDGGATIRAEATAFQQMAAQGQSVFAASGDYGAFSKYGTHPRTVLDPASDPYVTGVGGTTLSVATPGSNMSYSGETAWIGSGGGVSSIWPQPFWQAAVNAWINGGSTTARNVPDVSLNSNPATGYDIYSAYYGGFITVGGTSAAAPLWGAFTALVNQSRAQFSLGRVGFANPALYGIYTASLTQYPYGALDFHDITSGNNSYYAAGFGAGNRYDNVTGLGSFLGWQLFYEMIQAPTQLAPPVPPTNFAAKPGNTTVYLTWTKSPGASKYLIYRSGSVLALIGTATGTSYKATGLSNGTSYTFYAVATNAGGASNYSASSSATPAVVSITAGPTVPSKSSGKATIAWTTNVMSNSTVTWGTSTVSLTHVVTSSTMTQSHSVSITGLPTTHGTPIYFYVQSKDDAGVTTTSGINSFLTP